MRFFLLTSLLALISTTLAVSTPRAGGVAKLRQATRAQIVRRMQGRQGLGRRQSLPSAGVYPTCPDSEPNSAGSSVTAYAKFIQIRTLSSTDPDYVNPVLQTEYDDTPQDCRASCISTTGCAGSTFTDGVPFSTDAVNCVLYSTYTGAISKQDATSSYIGYTCAELAQIGGGGDLTCCNFYTS